MMAPRGFVNWERGLVSVYRNLSGNVMEINNTRHIANPNVVVARTIYGTYQDFDFDWDNAGENAHYAPFSWKGSRK